jgi:putative addiction module killer protein
LEIRIQARITNYIDRVAAGGSKKNIRALGDGIFEIKMDFGPGYRVYFGELSHVIILLVLGGDKHTQDKDIKLAKKYWREYVQK